MASHRSYWNRKLRLIASLLAIWAFVAFGLSILGAEALNQFSLGGIPFGFWMAQQGSIFVFVALLLFFALASDRLDRQAGLSPVDPARPALSDESRIDSGTRK